MRKVPPISGETVRKAIVNQNQRTRAMGGWFGGDDKVNVVVSNAANGKAEASLDLPVPFWEIVVIAAVVSVLVFFCVGCLKNKMKRHWEQQVRRQVARSRPSIVEL